MNKKYYFFSFLALTTFVVTPVKSNAQENPATTGDMTVDLKVTDPKYGILDPENKGEELIPEEGYGQTSGPLRIDFAPKINFNSNKIVDQDISYAADALLFKGQIAPRGSFVQVSDYRPNPTGWKLQVRQETQFKNQNKENSMLNGAVISLDKSWLSAAYGMGPAPTISKEVIHLNNIGETYTLAEAKKGTGAGTWSIVFGASKDNNLDQQGTLTPRVDDQGKPVTRPDFENQSVYMNDAINLAIPKGTTKDPGSYSTVITWLITELP